MQQFFNALADYADAEWLFVVSGVARAHQNSGGATSSDDNAIGHGCGVWRTKVYLAVDSLQSFAAVAFLRRAKKLLLVGDNLSVFMVRG
ncbi:hypothetical protein J2T55_002127 [Methylohalomonas lacus]|uniref:Uncharacterized protein n=1 Tax=Methylohalomonas lacus TaxID=398773 RepID=A0AAE3HMX5_9GAMM|nr:hypothetical protein [Methylohalomonas lacus]MCS3904094.1 hypothetical protein [Methylohalomonas lacus]